MIDSEPQEIERDAAGSNGGQPARRVRYGTRVAAAAAIVSGVIAGTTPTASAGPTTGPPRFGYVPDYSGNWECFQVLSTKPAAGYLGPFSGMAWLVNTSCSTGGAQNRAEYEIFLEVWKGYGNGVCMDTHNYDYNDDNTNGAAAQATNIGTTSCNVTGSNVYAQGVYYNPDISGGGWTTYARNP